MLSSAFNINKILKLGCYSILFSLFALFPYSIGSASESIKVAIVSFLSGPAAGDYGVPAKLAAESIVESINSGTAPYPYNMVGFSGTKIKLVFLDESGGSVKQVSEFRQLVLRQEVDFVIGYLSSSNCLAISPVAEELKVLTILMDCGTAQIFEKNNYRYVFRTRPHATMDAVAGVRYLTDLSSNIRTYAGINPNYAYGQESWRDWTLAMSVLLPSSELKTSQMPKLGSGQYGAEITALMNVKPDLIHSSLWGGDLQAFLMQATPRGLFKNRHLMLVAGEPNIQRLVGIIPDGTIVGSRGMIAGMVATNNPLDKWLKKIFKERTGYMPTYPVYSVAQALLALKKAFEKARLLKVQKAVPMADVAGVREGMEEAYRPPTTEQVVDSLKYLSFKTPNGNVHLSHGNGHQAVQDTSYGMIRTTNGKIEIHNIKIYPSKLIHPPPKMKSIDWLKNGLLTLDEDN